MQDMAEFRTQAEQMGIRLAAEQEEQLEAYVHLLDRWNTRINLTALEGRNRIRRLVLEPLWVAEQLKPTGRYLDVGSGNGSPGIPWHVRCGFAQVDLVEAHGRKAVFLQEVVRGTGMRHVSVHPTRLEAIHGLKPVNWFSVQGIRLTEHLYRTLRSLSHPGGRLAWFTGAVETPFRADQRLDIPGSARCVYVFLVGDRTSSGPD